VVTAFFGSNLLYYTLREGGFAHGLSAATAAVYVLAWLRLEERPSVGRWAQLGAAAGLMLVTYWVSGLVLLLPVFTFVRLLIAALRGAHAQRGQKTVALHASGNRTRTNTDKHRQRLPIRVRPRSSASYYPKSEQQLAMLALPLSPNCAIVCRNSA
jgi:hypothetical protein